MPDVNVRFLKKEVVGSVLKATLGNGIVVQVDYDKLSQEMQRMLGLHGLGQKVGDAAAGYSKARDFHGAFGAMQQVADNLEAGVWASRSGGGTSDLVQVLAELQGASVEEAQAAVDKMDEETMKKVKGHPAVKKGIADLVAKRAAEQAKASNVELSDLLEGIM